MSKKETKENKIETKIKLEDNIGRDKFIDAIINLINHSDINKPWSFAIDGKWGSGKTFVLNMLEEKLNKDENMIVVKYDAWKNDFYEDPLIAILYNILDSSKLDSKLKTLSLGIQRGLDLVSSLCGFIPGYNDVKSKIKKVHESYTKTIKSSDKITLNNNYISYNDSLDVVKKQIIDSTEKKKLIILVDEIDRCSPDYALKVLNRLHNLFNIPKTFVISAINKESLEKTIETMYGNDGKEYLNKIFDLSLKLENFGEKDTITIISDDFIQNTLPGQIISPLQKEMYKSLIKSYIDTNARERNHSFQIINFIMKNIHKEQKNFNFLTLITYLWLATKYDKSKNFIGNSFARTDIVYDFSGLIKSFEQPNSNFIGCFGKFLNENIRTQYSTVGSLTYYKSNNKEIDGFISLLNIFRYAKFKDSYITINRLYGTNYSEKDYIEVLKIIDFINLIYEGHK